MSNYNVVEIFSSINGEGQRAGQLALFIRMQGCNLNCSFCDTKWANEDNCRSHWASKEELIDVIRMMGIKNVTLTGGEPLLQENIHDLIQEIVNIPDTRLEIETNGSVDLSKFRDITPAPVFNMDYKLPGSEEESKMFLDNLNHMEQRDTVKFVISHEEDMYRALEVMKEYNLQEKTHVYFSPVFDKIEPETIVNFMKSHHLNDVNLQLQIHKIIWDSEMRGV